MRVVLVRQVLWLVGLAFVPAIGQALYYRGSPAWGEPPADSALVSVAEAKKWGSAVVWVDARADEQFASGHIPGALPLNEDHWDEQLSQVLAAAVSAPERKLVVYCSRLTCNASHEVAERLRKEDRLQNVYVLQGGWEQWQKESR